MKIICFSDTHNLHRNTVVPQGDMLIFAGDMTSIGEKNELFDFNNWLGTLPHKYKIVIAGNHDLCLENESEVAESLLSNAIYLNNSGIEIEGFKIWGSPISPKFGIDWAFNKVRGREIRAFWEMIPKDTDILITHCPPFGILDKNELNNHEGCADLLTIVQEEIKPRLHIFGHIHESQGQIKIGNTEYINASMVLSKNWINDYTSIKWLKNKTIQSLLFVERLQKVLFGISKYKIARKSIMRFRWKVSHQVIVVDI